MNKLAAMTNKYYTIIPHKKVPIINGSKRLHQEIELIETLKQMMFTNKILKRRSKRMNPIDAHYNALRCDIRPISKYSAEYNLINKSLQGTHASTHSQYTLKIMDIFEVNRKCSEFRHLPFRKNCSNLKLLWHGSRLSNFVGILSQGLRIAPPEAPATGYMFGKGVYFADCSSKSANYVHATQQHPFGLLILSQVALGKIYETTKAKHFEKAPIGYHSVKAIGKNIPNTNKQHIADIDGYELSLGPLLKNHDQNIIENGSLLYNEYIVYDVAQVRMKYIVLIKFEFK